MNGLKLRELLRVLDPATSIEIEDLDSNDDSFYCGFLLNLTYYQIEGLLEKYVNSIRMRTDENGYCVCIVIKVTYFTK